MSKTMPLAAFLRSFPVRSFEVMGVAKSMDETEYEIEIAQVAVINGLEKWFDSKLYFKGIKIRETPWPKMKVVRCRAIGEGTGTFEMVDDKGAKAELSYQECMVTYPDDYETLYRR